MKRRTLLVASSILVALLAAAVPADAGRWFDKQLVIPDDLERDFRDWLETVENRRFR